MSHISVNVINERDNIIGSQNDNIKSQEADQTRSPTESVNSQGMKLKK
jgi:hypothetical protein